MGSGIDDRQRTVAMADEYAPCFRIDTDIVSVAA
jgi:hypothetical protein